MTVIEKSGKVLTVRFNDLPTSFTATDGTIFYQILKAREGRVICPDCGQNTIAFITRNTKGRDIGGHCNRCKKRFWFDVTD